MLWLKIFNPCSVSYHFNGQISPFATITVLHGRLIIGDNCKIESNSVISAVDGRVSMGNRSFVNRNCQIVSHELVEIGDDVMIGPNVIIMDHDHKVEGGLIKKHDYATKKIVIEDGAWIGANCVILKGVRVGKGAIVAAGSIITHDCPANSVNVQKRKTEVFGIEKK